jgi:hypothetical protein
MNNDNTGINELISYMSGKKTFSRHSLKWKPLVGLDRTIGKILFNSYSLVRGQAIGAKSSRIANLQTKLSINIKKWP